MPQLKDLLQYLTMPGLEDIWVLLDIKPDNNAEEVMQLIASTLAEVTPSTPWNQRVVLGCWTVSLVLGMVVKDANTNLKKANFLPLCEEHLPRYPITHIGVNISYARQFLKVPNVSFNMLQKIMVGPFGEAFLSDVRAEGRLIFFWTVNDELSMKWSIYKQADGVITDDPKKYLEVCEKYEGEKVNQTVSSLMFVVLINMLVTVFSFVFRSRFVKVTELKKARVAVEG
jgi:phosphatidylglycerol phospholipase C